jgi:Flp pilus assembly protein TadG
MRRIWAALRRARRGAIAVEFALVLVFILFPLIAGCWDVLAAINMQTQLNTALRTLYYYAWSNPPQADNMTALHALLAQIDLPNSSETATTSTISFNTATLPYCYVPTGTAPCAGTPAPCAGLLPPQNTAPTPPVYVCYHLQAPVSFPVAIPPFTNVLTLSAAGAVRIY